MDTGELNDAQFRFCREYVVDQNGSQAAIRAGYSSHTAKEQASQLLTKLNIKDKIAELQAHQAKITELKAKDVVEELKAIGFSDLSNYLKEGMDLKDFRKLPKEISSAIASCEIHKVALGGDDEGYKEIVKFKLHDKLKALDSLGKNFGIYEAHNRQKSGLDLTKLTEEQLLALAEIQAAAQITDDND